MVRQCKRDFRNETCREKKYPGEREGKVKAVSNWDIDFFIFGHSFQIARLKLTKFEND
jgi:hypothetical protein